MPTTLATMVFEAWNDLDRVTAGLRDADAQRRSDAYSPISWTVAHCTQMVDSWLNVTFQGRAPHPIITGPAFRKDAVGDPLEWSVVQAAVRDVREAAQPWLESLADGELDRRAPYHGSLQMLREAGISPRYALVRIAAHHYFHVGEIATARHALGHEVGDFPGALERCI